MNFWSRMRSWVRNVLKRPRMEEEMEAELRSHIEAYTDDLIRGGMPREEAARRARIEFGGIERTKEECRDVVRVNRVESILQDARFGLRMLRKSPGFTAITVLTLGVGVGLCTATFSVVEAVLLRQLPYKNANRLVLVWGTGGRTENRDQISFTDLQDWRRESHSFEEMANFHSFVYTLTGKEESERIRAAQVTEGYFRVMQSTPELGRYFCRIPRVRVLLCSLCTLLHKSEAQLPPFQSLPHSCSKTPGVYPRAFLFSDSPLVTRHYPL